MISDTRLPLVALISSVRRESGKRLHIYMYVDQYCTRCSCVTGSFSGLEQSRAAAVCLFCGVGTAELLSLVGVVLWLV